MARRPSRHPSADAAIEFDTPPAEQQSTQAAAPAAEQQSTQAAAPAAAPAATSTSDTTAQELEVARGMLADLEAQQADVATMRQELESLRSGSVRAQALEAELQEARAQLASAATQRAVQSIDDVLNKIQLDDEDQVDAETFRIVKDKALRPILQQITETNKSELAALREEMKGYRQEATAQVQDLRDVDARNSRIRTNEAIFGAHPDFETVRKTKSYETFLAQTIPGARQTYGSAMAEAYKGGDATYINTVLTAFKSTVGGKNKAALAEPSGVGAMASSVAGQQQGNKFKYTDLAEQRHNLAAGRITRLQFAAFNKEFEKAEAEGLVS